MSRHFPFALEGAHVSFRFSIAWDYLGGLRVIAREGDETG